MTTQEYYCRRGQHLASLVCIISSELAYLIWIWTANTNTVKAQCGPRTKLPTPSLRCLFIFLTIKTTVWRLLSQWWTKYLPKQSADVLSFGGQRNPDNGVELFARPPREPWGRPRRPVTMFLRIVADFRRPHCVMLLSPVNQRIYFLTWDDILILWDIQKHS